MNKVLQDLEACQALLDQQGKEVKWDPLDHQALQDQLVKEAHLVLEVSLDLMALLE